jgi:nickel-dependent lactate racemase
VQAIKALVNNYEAVRPGGTIILAAECAEGMAPWLRELCRVRDRDDLERRTRAGELRHPHNALFLQAVNQHARVIMVSNLAEEDVRALGFHQAESLEAAAALADELTGPPKMTFVVPFGNTTVVRVPSAKPAAEAAA